MFGIDISKSVGKAIGIRRYTIWTLVMEKDESDGYFRATVDLADGIFHYQFKSKETSSRWTDLDRCVSFSRMRK